MSANKWTPGPWKAVEEKSEPMPWTVMTNDGYYVASIHFACPPDRTGKANACLLAAAPELVKIVQRYLATADGKPGKVKDDLASVDASARALLARIKGEA